MVRTVAADQGQLEAFLDSLRRSGCTLQVGLLVGNLGAGSAKDVVYALIPTPLKDGVEAATVAPSSTESHAGGRRGGRSKPAADTPCLKIDADWVAEHGRQVWRMLLGGMHVVGIYVVCLEAAIKNSQLTLWQVLKALAASLSLEVHKSDMSEMLLLHIGTSPRRLVCRSCSLETSFSSTLLKPCDWKLQKIAANLHLFSSMYAFKISVPVMREGGKSSKSFKDDVVSAIKMEAGRLKSVKAMVDGSVVVDLNSEVSHSDNVKDHVHCVELLLPLDCALSTTVGDGRRVGGLVCLSGTVSARAVGYAKEPLARIVSYLKDDIISSLRSRLELLCEQAEDEENMARDAESGTSLEQLLICRSSAAPSHHAYCTLPRRVLIPWQDGTMVCDYLLPGDTLQDVKDRCQELLGMDGLETSDILEAELLPPPPTLSKDRRSSRPSVNNPAVSSTHRQPSCFLVASSLALLFLAVLIASSFGASE